MFYATCCYSGPNSNTVSTQGAPDPLENHAFTVGGACYKLEKEFQNRPKPWLVTAKAISTKSYNDVKEQQGISNLTEFHVREQDNPSTVYNEQRYLVIGVTPCRKLTPKDVKVTIPRFRPVAESIPNTVHKPEASGILAIRVVTPYDVKTHDDAVKLYALAYPDSGGLCHAYVIAQPYTFYFHEYRDVQTNQEVCKATWNDLVKRQRRIATKEDRRLGKSIRSDLEPDLLMSMRLLNDSLAASNHSAAIGVIAKLSSLAARIGPIEADQEAIIETFLDGRKVMGSVQIDQVLTAMNVFWIIPDISEIFLRRIREALESQKIHVQLRYGREFMVHVIGRLVDTSGTLMVDVKRLLDRIVSSSTEIVERPTVSLYTDGQEAATALKAEIEWLSAFRQKVFDYGTEIGARFGHQQVPGSMDEIYGRLPYAITKDENRLLFDQALCFQANLFEMDMFAICA